MKIMALDLGKNKTAVCEFAVETSEVRHLSVKTRRAEIEGLLDRHRPERVVMEVGPIAGWVSDLARRRGLELEVANPSTEGWRWRNVKKKTDRLDALKLARLSAMGQLPQVHMPSPGVRQWRSLIGYRDHLVGRRSAIKHRIRDILLRQGLTLPGGNKAWTQKGLVALSELGADWSDCGEDLWRGELFTELKALEQAMELVATVEQKLDALGEADERVQLLRTMDGVGPRLSEAVVAILDDPHRFRNGRQVGSLAGLAPRGYQSGQSQRMGRISKAGSGLLRKLLVQVSWLGLRNNAWMRETYERIHRGIKTRKKIAIVAVARRLLVVLWAMLRDGQRWRRPEPPAASEPEQRRGLQGVREFLGCQAAPE